MAQDIIANVEERDGNANETSTPTTAAKTSSSTAHFDAESSGGPGGDVNAPGKKHGALRRFFWMDERLSQACAKYLGPGQPGWTEFDLARETQALLEEIKELGEGSFHVLLLVRNEVLLLVRCHMLGRGLGAPRQPMGPDDWAQARQVPLIDEIWNNVSLNERKRIEACFGFDGESYIVGLDPKERGDLIALLKELASTLMKPLESDAREIDRVHAQRWLRVGGTALLLLVGLGSAMVRILDKSGSVNLALHRPVTTSSQLPGAVPDIQMLVDGDHTKMGFHTQNGPDQFAIIDLGSVKKFDKVVVYNRVDCCKERAVPLRLEVSEDGTAYQKLQDRTEVFDVWTASMLRARGRYVRLRLLESNYLHLDEVEIY